MPRVEAVTTSLPEHRLPQSELRAVAEAMIPEGPSKAGLLEVFDNARIDERALAMPVDWYLRPHGFAERNAAYTAVGLPLIESATRAALDQAGLAPKDVDGVVLVSTTGIATPSLEARLANRMGFKPGFLRLPVFGLGCAGGVAGLARAADMATAHPDGRFLVVAMELCSLSFDIGTALAPGAGGFDKKSLISASLFSDGCAAAIVSGDAKTNAGPRFVAGASHLFPDTERVMGWDVEDSHLEVVLSPKIPALVEGEMKRVVQPFLDRHLAGGRPDHWVLHPGGAKVIDAYAKAMGLSDRDLAVTNATLRAHGNMSSPTVLFALERTLRDGRMRAGQTALLAALGPGFAGELALLVA